jgi:hypothetical protein
VIDERERVLRAFVRDGRLRAIPARAGKRRVLHEEIVQDFEPGRQYPEREVKDIHARWHPDVAALRRYLVDDCLLSRTPGIYWRSGGAVDTTPPT